MIRIVAIIMLIMTGLMSYPASHADEGRDLLQSIDRKLNPESYEFYRKIINIEPDGNKKDFTLYSVKKDHDKVAAIFLSPASEKGRTTLRLGENIWLYIPNVGKPIRITSVQSVTGGVFNNADIMGLDYSVEYTIEKKEDKGDTLLLSMKARSKSVAYDRLRMVVDRKTLLPLQIECMTEAGMLIKTLYFKQIKDFGGGIVRPSVIETDSPLQKGYRSIMIFANMKSRKLSNDVFTLNFMSRLESLIK
jgi:outer membrane lipoprotein-sorting protein